MALNSQSVDVDGTEYSYADDGVDLGDVEITGDGDLDGDLAETDGADEGLDGDAADEADVDAGESDADGDGDEGDDGPGRKAAKKQKGLQAALTAERKKRQAVETQRRESEARTERELAQLRGQLQALMSVVPRAGAQDDLPPPPDLPEIDWTDPDKSLKAHVEAHLDYRNQLQSKQRAAAEFQDWSERLESSKYVARQDFEDYDAVEARFDARVKQDTKLWNVVKRQPDPARWAYENQKRFEKRTTKPSKDVESLQARIAELEAQTKDGDEPSGSRSLSRARGSSPKARPTIGPRNERDWFKGTFSPSRKRA